MHGTVALHLAGRLHLGMELQQIMAPALECFLRGAGAAPADATLPKDLAPAESAA